MMAIWLIATNTLRETTRRRIFYNIVLFGLCLVMLALVVSNVTFSFADRVVRSIGLSGVSIAVDLLALLVAVSLVHDEVERKTVFVVLTRPPSRTQYLIGRYLGLMATVALMLGGLSLLQLIVLLFSGGSVTANDVLALAMVLMEAATLGAIGVTLSCLTTPTLGAGIGIGAWIIGASTDDFVELTRDEPISHAIAQVTSYLFPSMSRFNFREAAVYQTSVDPQLVAWGVAYGVLHVTAVLALGSLIFSRRDMT